MVATRIYLPSSGSAPISPAVSASWEQSASGFTRGPCSTVKANTSLSDFSDSFGPAVTGQTCLRQWISPQLNVDQSISSAGTFDIVVRGSEGAASHNLYLAVCVRVVSADGSTVRGVLKFQGTNTGGTEYGTANQTRIWSALAITTVAALAGDRLVIEVGWHGASPASGATGLLRFGDPSGTGDFALTSGLTTDLCPWIEFTQAITFGTPNSLAPEPAITTTAVPSPAVSASLDLAATPAVTTFQVVNPTLTLASASIDLAPTPAITTTQVPSPSASGSLGITPDPAVASTQVPSPAVSGSLGLAAEPAITTTQVPSPAVSASLNLAAEPAITTAAVPSPDASSSLGITPDPAVATFQAVEPVASATLTLAAEPAIVTVEVPIPLSFSGIVLAPTPAVASTQVPSPDASSQLDITPDPAVATFQVVDPDASGTLGLDLDVAVVLVLVPDPSLSLAFVLDFAVDPSIVTLQVPPPVLALVFSSPPTRSLETGRLARSFLLDRWPPATRVGS